MTFFLFRKYSVFSKILFLRYNTCFAKLQKEIKIYLYIIAFVALAKSNIAATLGT